MARKQTSEKEVVLSGGAASAPARRKTAGAAHKKHGVTQPETVAAAALDVEIAGTTGVQAMDGGEPTYDEIARLAYSYWEARGCQGGCPEEDWTRAEQELRTR